jgi:hypothetical protein
MVADAQLCKEKIMATTTSNIHTEYQRFVSSNNIRETRSSSKKATRQDVEAAYAELVGAMEEMKKRDAEKEVLIGALRAEKIVLNQTHESERQLDQERFAAERANLHELIGRLGDIVKAVDQAGTRDLRDLKHNVALVRFYYNNRASSDPQRGPSVQDIQQARRKLGIDGYQYMLDHKH